MPATMEAVRPIELAEIREARDRIAKTIVRTPLVRLELGPDYPDIYLKLENLQPARASEGGRAADHARRQEPEAPSTPPKPQADKW